MEDPTAEDTTAEGSRVASLSLLVLLLTADSKEDSSSLPDLLLSGEDSSRATTLSTSREATTDIERD